MTRNSARIAALCPVLLLALAFGANGQDDDHSNHDPHGAHATHDAHDAHAGHDMSAMAGMDSSEATLAYAQSMAVMHEDMTIQPSGDADIDFVRGMIPHHQGAVDMAKIVLKYGKDPEIRKLAEEIIAAQDHEIHMMKQWLADNNLALK